MPFVRTRVEIEGHVSYITTEIPEVEAPHWGPDQKFNVVGQRLPRIDGHNRVTGRATYSVDYKFPGLLTCKVLRSPYPHARIMDIDTSAAEKVPGVLGILTHKNMDMRFSAMQRVFEPVVRYVGDEVAAVAAEDEFAARDALDLIKVTYEPLPFVLDPLEALKAGAPKVHPDGNLTGGKPRVLGRGDVQKGLAEADTVVELTMTVPVQTHCCMEPHGCTVKWDGDELTSYESTQTVYLVQRALASAFNLPRNKVRVIMQYVGGGFGSKTGMDKHSLIAGELARRTARPVRLHADRWEEVTVKGHRPLTVQKVKIGAKKDGTLTAIHLVAYIQAGAYATGPSNPGGVFREMYACPNVRTEEHGVRVNIHSTRAMRGPGNVEGMAALELAIDQLGYKLGMDPMEIRRKNYTPYGDQAANIPYTSKGLLEAYDMGAKAIDWTKNRHKQPGSDPGPVKRGIGMGSLIWSGGGGPPSGANVVLDMDGTVTVQSAFNELGEGPKTIAAMVCAEELGVPYESVKVYCGDTQGLPIDQASYGSRVTPSLMPAIRNAALDARRKVLQAAAAFMDLKEEDLVLEKGVIGVKGNAAKNMTLQKLMSSLTHVITGTGFRGPNPSTHRINVFGAQFCEVEVDTRTGQVKILRFVAAHDCGRAINPMLVESQIYSGLYQGIGYVMTEERVYDRNSGVNLSSNYVDYKLPTSLDSPSLTPMIVPQVDMFSNNTGTKGMAEPPCIPTAPAVLNAVYNATGIMFTEFPLTPARVLKALQEKRA